MLTVILSLISGCEYRPYTQSLVICGYSTLLITLIVNLSKVSSDYATTRRKLNGQSNPKNVGVNNLMADYILQALD